MAPAPYEAFREHGPVSPTLAREMAVTFETRTIYRDDFRWIVDSYLHMLEQAAKNAAELAAARANHAQAMQDLGAEQAAVAQLQAEVARLRAQRDDLQARNSELVLQRRALAEDLERLRSEPHVPFTPPHGDGG